MSVDAIAATAVQGPDSEPAQVAGAIKQASASTGANFEYLVAAAKIESDLKPNSSASTSSARGLYQFIDQTWLGTVKEAGASLGYAKYADAITKLPSGNYTVSDPALRQQVLNLRSDPAANAAMAGALTQSNSFKLVSTIGRRPTNSELYMAHFLGVGGASRLISANESRPQASAVHMFSRAAAANKSIFYDRNGVPRSVAGVYAELTRRYVAAANSSAALSTIALAGGTPQPLVPQPSAVVASAAPVAATSYLSAMPPISAAQPTALAPSATAGVQPAVAIPPTNGTQPFRSLFQVGDRPDPISPAVRELWATGAAQAHAAPDAAGQRQKQASPINLFSDPDGAFATPAVNQT